MSDVIVRKAESADHAAVTALLRSASLPVEGVAGHLQHFLVAENGAGIIGAIGLEVYDATALLRSAVVTPALQNKGIGTLLYDRLLRHARSIGIQRLILLTTTAEKYFERKGFRTIGQKSVTGPIRQSAEFTGACPDTAVCMELDISQSM